MKIALIDNGSLAAASQLNLRRVADGIARTAGVAVEAVSWKHSDRIPAEQLGGAPAVTLAPWVREHAARGECDFLFIPFFVSPQGAIGTALRSDLDALGAGLRFTFTTGLESALPRLVATRIREAALPATVPIIVVDHGGPSPTSAALRNRIASDTARELRSAPDRVIAASMESPDGPGFDFNRPLFADALAHASPRGDVLVAPLFLSPGRHAGPGGDLFRIAEGVKSAHPSLRYHFTDLPGTLPDVVSILAGSLSASISSTLPSSLS